jgi:long-chain acyl-CoA synthetase
VDFDPVLVHEWLRRSARRHPSRLALICREQRLSYADIDTYSDQLAITLQAIGVKRHDRVLIFLDNSAETVISVYGVLKAGGAFCIVSPLLKAEKLSYVLLNSQASCIIADTGKHSVVEESLSGQDHHCKLIWVQGSAPVSTALTTHSITWDEALSPLNGRITGSQVQQWPRLIDRDLAALIYTSASTGEAKGIVSTHHNMVSAARSIIQYIGNTENDVILNVLPLSFDYGLYQVIMTFMTGGTLVLEKGFVYMHEVLQILAREKVTGFPIVPTILAMLLKMENLQRYDLASLRYMTNTGAALPADHIRRIQQVLPHVRFYSMFGLTECKRVCYLPPEQLDAHPLSVGFPMPNCEVSIVDPSGQPVPPGTPGEMVVRGSNVMQGYWNDPALSAHVFRRVGLMGEPHLHTGDIFRQEVDGSLYFLGRSDDMIKRGGERISPREIENVICHMGEVSEAAVLGMPDDVLGQAILAVVVPQPGNRLSPHSVLQYCAKHLESFMIPRSVIVAERLPKTPNGKVDKKRLLSELASRS